MGGTYDLVVDQCALFERQLVWKKCAGTIYDLTGWTGRMQVRDRPGGNLIIEVPVTLGGTAGTIDIRLTSVQTCALPASCFVYELDLIDADLEVRRLLSGQFAVRPAIYRTVTP